MNELQEYQHLLEELEIKPIYFKTFESYPDVLTVNDICKMLRVDKKKVQKLLKQGHIKSIRYDRSVRIAKVWVLEYLQAQGERSAQTIHEERQAVTLKFCKTPRSCLEICRHLGMSDKPHCRQSVLAPLMAQGRLVQTIPATPNHIKQKYLTIK